MEEMIGKTEGKCHVQISLSSARTNEISEQRSLSIQERQAANFAVRALRNCSTSLQSFFSHIINNTGDNKQNLIPTGVPKHVPSPELKQNVKTVVESLDMHKSGGNVTNHSTENTSYRLKNNGKRTRIRRTLNAKQTKDENGGRKGAKRAQKRKKSLALIRDACAASQKAALVFNDAVVKTENRNQIVADELLNYAAQPSLQSPFENEEQILRSLLRLCHFDVFLDDAKLFGKILSLVNVILVNWRPFRL